MFRLDRLLAELVDSASRSFNTDPPDCSSHDTATVSSHRQANSSLFTVTDARQSATTLPWYDQMMTNLAQRRGTRYPLPPTTDHVEEILQTESNRKEGEVSEQRDFGVKLTEVKLILIVMDALLVVYRLVNLSDDVQRLSSACPPQSTGDPSAVRPDNSTTNELPGDVTELKTTSRLRGGPKIRKHRLN